MNNNIQKQFRLKLVSVKDSSYLIVQWTLLQHFVAFIRAVLSVGLDPRFLHVCKQNDKYMFDKVIRIHTLRAKVCCKDVRHKFIKDSS